MKVHKSSIECEEYNTKNIVAIEAGLMDFWEPDEPTLAQEKKFKEEKEKGTIRTQNTIQLLHTIWAWLPEKVRVAYLEPKDEKSLSKGFDGWSLLAAEENNWLPAVELEAYNQRTNTWSNRCFAYYRLNVGNYGDVSRLKLNTELTITPAQITKCVTTIVAKYDVAVQKNQLETVKAQLEQRTNEWGKSHPDFCKAVGVNPNYSFHSDSYGVAFWVNEDDTIRIGEKTHTYEQWQRIYALRAQHESEMKTLEAIIAAENTDQQAAAK